jgi:hypothetical protein
MPWMKKNKKELTLKLHDMLSDQERALNIKKMHLQTLKVKALNPVFLQPF